MRPRFVVWETTPAPKHRAHGYRALGMDYARKGVERKSLCGMVLRTVLVDLSFETKVMKCRLCRMVATPPKRRR